MGWAPAGKAGVRGRQAVRRGRPGTVPWVGARLVNPRRLVVDFWGRTPDALVDPRSPIQQ
jgi:hypothetical protein